MFGALSPLNFEVTIVGLVNYTDHVGTKTVANSVTGRSLDRSISFFRFYLKFTE